MTKNDALMTRARRIDPKPTNPFEGFAGSPEAEEILDHILQTPAGVRSTRRSRRGSMAGLVAAAVLASAGAVAAGVAMSRPDPDQSAQVERDFSSQAQSHLAGWRPELAAENVFCLIPGGDDLLTSASDFPLHRRLSSERLVEACAENGVSGSEEEMASTASPTLCISDREAPIAIVGLGGIDCSTAPLEDGSNGRRVQTRAMRPGDLDRLNFMRAVEVAVLAVPTGNGCATSEEAAAWAEARLEENGIDDLEIRVSDEGEGCYRARMRWNTEFSFDGGGEVWIARLGNQP